MKVFNFLLLSLQELASGCSPTEQQTVYIINTLPVESPPLKARCGFDGRDLEDNVLYHDQDFHWSYCDDSDGKVLSCNLQWRSKSATFNAFRVSSKSRVSESFWSARSDGVFLRDTVGNERKVDWKN